MICALSHYSPLTLLTNASAFDKKRVKKNLKQELFFYAVRIIT